MIRDERKKKKKKKNVSETKITYDEICIPFSNDYYIDWDRKGIETEFEIL